MTTNFKKAPKIYDIKSKTIIKSQENELQQRTS